CDRSAPLQQLQVDLANNTVARYNTRRCVTSLRRLLRNAGQRWTRRRETEEVPIVKVTDAVRAMTADRFAVG
ncbi:MAG: hypothetical protein WAV78_00985, partial [Xanthobacteraceae bacterium]